MAQAREALEGAELLAQRALWTSCVNRLYYACFYAFTAVLADRGVRTTKHTEVRSALNRDFVRTGVVSKELGSFYNRLFRRRHEGDYTDFVRFDGAQVRPWVKTAREFIDSVEALMEPDASA